MTELTFKVQPKPEHEATLVARFPDSATACAAAYRTLRSPLTPSGMELLPDNSGVRLVIHVGGFAKPVARSLADLTGFAREAGAVDVSPLSDGEAERVWENVRAGPGAPNSPD